MYLTSREDANLDSIFGTPFVSYNLHFNALFPHV